MKENYTNEQEEIILQLKKWLDWFEKAVKKNLYYVQN